MDFNKVGFGWGLTDEGKQTTKRFYNFLCAHSGIEPSSKTFHLCENDPNGWNPSVYFETETDKEMYKMFAQMIVAIFNSYDQADSEEHA